MGKETVKVDALVVLRIIKHCQESLPNVVTGQLLGLCTENVEVTGCFPIPSTSLDTDDGGDFQLEMLRCLREVNIDNNTVGWYQSTYLGSFVDETLIENQFAYQENIEGSVLIICDPLRLQEGLLALKAIRLQSSFMKLYRERKFSQEDLKQAGLSFSDIFEELPVEIHNNNLSTALLYSLQEQFPSLVQTDFDALDMSFSPFLERNLELLIDCIDDLAVEHNRYQNHEKYAQKIKASQQAWIAKRKAENAERALKGEEPLSEDVTQSHGYKAIPAPPSRLDALLVTNQVKTYCEQINSFASQSLNKLYLFDQVQQ
eukprot:GCRY01000953.1.p1 GENE.GCRY01000953.1~~GCRY01000953.1.p1  ORF type:complete len:316 (-),score=63.87 GCRY01000953.1:48-995(-)